MPHLIIESSKNIDQKKVEELHKEASKQDSIKIENLKTRLFIASQSIVADFEEQDQIAITLKLLPGRSDELKTKMSLNLITKARELFPDQKISVEITELGVYQK